MRMLRSSLSPLVSRLSGRAALSRLDEAALLALPFRHRRVEPGEYIIQEGDAAVSCNILLSGFAHRHRIAGDGTRNILGIHGEGDILNIPSLPAIPAEDFVQALTVAKVAAIPMNDMLALIWERPAVANALWVEMTAEVSVFRAWINNMGRRDARGRIAHLFCELVMRSHPTGGSDGCVMTLPLSQAELADATGMTAVHVNRTLKALQAEGLIQRDRRRIIIPDWRRLVDVAEFRATAWEGRTGRKEEEEERALLAG